MKPLFIARSALRHWPRSAVLGAVALLACHWVHSAPFEIAAAPARFEISADPGQRKGQSLDIHNLGMAATEVSLRTLDWTYSEDGKLSFRDELLPDSCRPWVALQQRTLKIGPRGKSAFRFEVTPPADAPRGECRFMIAIEGLEPSARAAMAAGGVGLDMPVSGRIAIAVYVAVGGASPKLEIRRTETQTLRGVRTPVVVVRNTGDAHGRLEGSLSATGSDGKEFDLVPDSSPILPGQMRAIALTPRTSPDAKSPPPMKLPLRTRGALDWDDGSFQVDADFRE